MSKFNIGAIQKRKQAELFLTTMGKEEPQPNDDKLVKNKEKRPQEEISSYGVHGVQKQAELFLTTMGELEYLHRGNKNRGNKNTTPSKSIPTEGTYMDRSSWGRRGHNNFGG